MLIRAPEHQDCGEYIPHMCVTHVPGKCRAGLATAEGDGVALLYGDAWDCILQSGRLTGEIDLDWFTRDGFGVDKVNIDKLPKDQPFFTRARGDRIGSPSQVRVMSEASYNGELVVKLWFEDKSKSLVVAVMPHAQAVNEGMNRHTDPTRAELIHKSLDGTLLSDQSEFLFSELAVKDM